MEARDAKPWRRAAWAFVLLGLALRLLRYGLAFPLWGDEAFVAVQVLSRDFAQLAAGLEHNQVAPLLFLWAEKAVVQLLGFSELTLRLVPLLASVVSLFLFRAFATRHLEPRAAFAAVAIFSVSYYPIRHGAEVKPYAVDLLLSVCVTVLAAECLRRPAAGRLLLLAALAGLGVWASFPLAFVAGGAVLALLPSAWRAGASMRAAWALFAFALGGSFLAMYVHVGGGQARAGEDLFAIWGHTFPPRTDPVALVRWLIETHTGHMFAHPAGGKNGASALTTILFVVGAVALARGSRKGLLALLLLPFALNLVAAALHAYPYGGSARWMLHTAPAVCALAGAGAARLCARRVRATCVAIGLLVVLGLFLGARDVRRPYKNAHDLEHRRIAEAFWPGAGEGVELVCLSADAGHALDEGSWARGDHAQYVCNQAIQRGAKTLDLTRVGPGRPLRLVVFRRVEDDDGAWERWRTRLGRAWTVVSEERFDVERRHKRKDPRVDRIEVLDLVPAP